MRKSLLRALLHNAEQVRELEDRDRKAFEQLKDLDLEDCLYEEEHYIKELQETVFRYEDKKFYSAEGIQEIDEYEKKLKEPLTNKEIEEMSTNQFSITYSDEEWTEIEEQYEFAEYQEKLEEIEDLIHDFLELTPEYRKIFHESVTYVLEVDEQEYGFESYEQIEKNKDIRDGQLEHKKMLEDMQKQMLEMTKVLMNSKSSNSEQDMIESSSILTMTQLCKRIKSSDDTIRVWCNYVGTDSEGEPLKMPHTRNGKRGNYKFNWELISKWNEVHDKWPKHL